MKQAEHPPVTAGANSAAEYSLAIIDQLARIGRTCSKEEMDELVYRLLAFVGGHLRSARENLRMLTLLEEKQKSLEQNLQAVKLEQQMLKALCKDSTSVYRVDLMNDRAEIVKIEEHSNSAGDLLPHGQELFSYAEAVEHYYHKCVLKESAPDFLQFLDAENLMRELRTKDRVSRRYNNMAIGMYAGNSGNALYCPTGYLELLCLQDRFVYLPEMPYRKVDLDKAARNVLTQEQFEQAGGEGTVASWRNTVTVENVHPNTTVSFRMNNLSGSAADLELYAYGADGKLAEVSKELWTITDETGTGVDTLADGTLYELRVSAAHGGAFDLSEAEKEIKISVVLAK